MNTYKQQLYVTLIDAQKLYDATLQKYVMLKKLAVSYNNSNFTSKHCVKNVDFYSSSFKNTKTNVAHYLQTIAAQANVNLADVHYKHSAQVRTTAQAFITA